MNKLDALKKIALFAYEHTVFYHKLYDAHGICIDTINSIEELPIVTPEDLIGNINDFKADIPLYKVAMTSGTVSYPKVLFRTKNDFLHSVDNEITLLKWAGISSNDSVCVAQPFGINGYGELTAAACEKLGIFYVPIGDVNDELLIDCIERFDITVLDITPSRLLRLLNHPQLKENKIRLAMVAGEHINQNFKSFVFEHFGIEIINQFGATECDCLAGEKINSDGMYCLVDDFIFEEISGQLVITSLYHHGTPLIRYCLGDYIDLMDGQINIKSRNESFQLFDGIKLNAQAISKIVEKYNGIQWQCIIYEASKRIVIKVCYTTIDKHYHGKAIKDELEKSIDFLNTADLIDIQCNVINEGISIGSRKQPRFIDLRNTNNTVRKCLLQNLLIAEFYYCLPNPLTGKRAAELISEIVTIDYPILWETIKFFVHLWTPKARLFLCKMLDTKLNEYRNKILIQSVCMSKSNDWEIREDAAKLIGMIIKTDFYGLSKWVEKNLHSKDENVRRSFLVGIKYCAQYESDTQKQKKMLNMLDILLFDSSRYVLKSLDSFTIGDGFLNICPELVDKKLESWLQLNDLSVNCKIIRVFRSSGGKKNFELACKYLKRFEDSRQPQIKKALMATKKYLQKHGLEVK